MICARWPITGQEIDVSFITDLDPPAFSGRDLCSDGNIEFSPRDWLNPDVVSLKQEYC